jgi:hypothetical protein
VAPKRSVGSTGSASNQISMGQPGQPRQTITINRAAMPAGTELSFGNFQTGNGQQTLFTLMDASSYTCTSNAPSANVAQGIYGIGFGSASSGQSSSRS